MNRTDRQLFDEVKLGHDWAWRELVRRYEQLVMSIALRCGLSKIDAEDCAQLSWLALYRNLDSIRDPDCLGAWLIRTTRRNATRIAKRLAVRSKYLERDDAVETEFLSDQEAIRLERQVQIEYAIGQMGDRCKELLRALFFSPEGDSYEEIADRLGISPNSIGPIRSRCLKQLLQILKECGFL